MQSLWMLFASFCFSIMGVCVKLASNMYSTAEIVLYRGAVGAVFILFFVLFRGGTFKTSMPWEHIWRGVIGVFSLWLWFYSFIKLPLATAMTLNYTAPIWIAAILLVLGWWRKKHHLDWQPMLAICISFIGVTLLLHPVAHPEQWFAGMVALSSGMFSALAYLQVRRLGQLGEPEYRVVFYFCVIGAVAGFAGSLIEPTNTSSHALWHPHSVKGMALLLGIGLSAVIAQMAMTRAFRLGNTLITANLQYAGIVFASLWGILLWNDVLDWQGWLGIALILLSGVTATFYNTREVKSTLPPSNTISAPDPISTEI